MKTTVSLLAAMFIGSAFFGYEVKVRVLDERAQIVSDVDVTIDFVSYTQGSGSAYSGKTDEKGEFKAVGIAKDSVYVLAEKTKHYSAKVNRLPRDKDIDYLIILPRIINPVPLFAKNVILKFPAQNEWLGFDFEVGGLVAPYGEGKTADILFKFKNEYLGWNQSDEKMARSRQINSQLSEDGFKKSYGKWDAELEISFPGEQEGLHEEMRFLAYSELRLPHEAPESGYVSPRHYTADTYSPRAERDKMGFFLRTRVQLDKEHNIISAHYSKLMGDFRLDARGQVSFHYYYNPTPNDRNLEWNPDRNLLPGLTNSETPRQP